MIFVASAADAPATPGAYALALRLGAPLDVRAGKSRRRFPPAIISIAARRVGPADCGRDWRDTCGRKNGRTGILISSPPSRACSAPLSRNRATNAPSTPRSAPILPIPIAGFGSSDCRRCAAHLRFWPEGAALPSRWENARKAAHLSLRGSRAGSRRGFPIAASPTRASARPSLRGRRNRNRSYVQRRNQNQS